MFIPEDLGLCGELGLIEPEDIVDGRAVVATVGEAGAETVEVELLEVSGTLEFATFRA